MSITLTLSEPINPAIDSKVLPKASEIAKNAIKNIPSNFPNVEDAVIDFRNAVYAVLQTTIVEYSSMFQGEEEAQALNSQANPVVTSQTSIKSATQNAQMRELREQRREKYLIEFNSNTGYPLLK